ALASVDPLDRLDDVLAALLDVVVGADGHRLDLLLGADHMFKGRAELNGKPPVRDKNEADHKTPRGRVPVAPHERTAIFTIRKPGAWGVLLILRPCCIAVFGRLEGGRQGSPRLDANAGMVTFLTSLRAQARDPRFCAKPALPAARPARMRPRVAAE